MNINNQHELELAEPVAIVIATGGPHDKEDRVLCELQAELPPVGTKLYASVPIPEGWKLVPIEPTEYMMKVARGLTMQQEQTPSAEYRAMVKSAPTYKDKQIKC